MAVGCVTWIIALLAILAVLASAKGQTGTLLRADHSTDFRVLRKEV